ncbi:MAG: Histidine kinase-, DNA gyrase B-, and HSP90-like ATPase [Rhodobacteraceae bacterium HLUCCA08]|nr:MAG: Histidine kinase-, DNA gyrase B-, and HSP90-like ATPase [Rhodobacteraceae bacterium HLUCCA08]
MARIADQGSTSAEPVIDDRAWGDVLQAMDRTYAELVDYQEQLEARNAELLTLRRLLTSIMTSISDYLVVLDRDGRIVDASVSFCQALGLDVARLPEAPIGDFVAPDDRDALARAIAGTLATRSEATLTADLTALAGPDRVEFRIAPRLDRRRRCTGVVLTGRPMGELLRAYADLERSHRELTETQGQLVRNEKLASLGRLLAGVAHELNNPISFVYANAHALEKYLDRFETYFDRVQAGASRDDLIDLRAELRLDRALTNLRTAIEGARDGAERVRNIVEDLRRLSADGAGEMKRFDLAETAQIAANWVKRGTRSDLSIAVSGDRPCIACGRPGHIQQVVMNLVQNAVDAMAGQQGATIRLRFAHRDGRAVLEVCDTGPGIPDAVAARIFDPFYTTKEVGKGTGLGLSISHKIAEEHGGTLSYLPKPEGGACFRLDLPCGDGA